VVATLDAAVQRVDQQVTRIDATPAPSPSVEPVGERMSAADFERAVRLGTLGERIVVVDGRMRLVIGRCRAGGSEDCSWLQLDGLPSVWIDKGDLDADEAGAAIRRHPNVAPIALRVSGYGVELIGWITAGASTPVEIAALLAGDLPLDPGEVVAVAGWVVGAHPDPPCAATPETCAMWPVLQAQAPIPDAQIGYGVASMATMVDDSLGLGPAPAFRAGPFLVGARRAPAAFEPGFEVVARFTDVLTVDPVPAPASAASPSPSSSAAAKEPRVVCNDIGSVWLDTDAHGSEVPISITLTCENAVAAAKASAGPQPATELIEFSYGHWCQPGFFCALALPNTGHVIFRRTGTLPDLLVGVTADAVGKVTATAPGLLPSSPTGD
jgi:hypothetical protein